MLRAIILATVLALGDAAQAAPESPVDLSDYGGKVVVVDFWASWCVPCRRSFPWLNSMHAKYAADGLVVVGVNLDAARADADAFLAEYPVDFRVVYDDDKVLAERFDVIAMPMSFVIGRDGRERARHYGFKVRKQADYEAAIVAALRD